MRSVSRTAVCAAAVLAGAGLAGCVTTQEKNARALLVNARTLASEAPVHVTQPDPSVTVVGVGFVAGPSRSAGAVVVRLRSSSDHALSDLPISVGTMERSGRRAYLNRRANIDYYDAHVPAIPAGATVSWVLPGIGWTQVTGRRLFAIVGIARRPASTIAAVLPGIRATASGVQSTGRLPVSVANNSGVPQYGLQVYATASRGGRVVAAAREAIRELDGGARTTITLPLTGTTSGATVVLYAPPTIFK